MKDKRGIDIQMETSSGTQRLTETQKDNDMTEHWSIDGETNATREDNEERMEGIREERTKGRKMEQPTNRKLQ